jgi:hypothetical protein
MNRKSQRREKGLKKQVIAAASEKIVAKILDFFLVDVSAVAFCFAFDIDVPFVPAEQWWKKNVENIFCESGRPGSTGSTDTV